MQEWNGMKSDEVGWKLIFTDTAPLDWRMSCSATAATALRSSCLSEAVARWRDSYSFKISRCFLQLQEISPFHTLSFAWLLTLVELVTTQQSQRLQLVLEPQLQQLQQLRALCLSNLLVPALQGLWVFLSCLISLGPSRLKMVEFYHSRDLKSECCMPFPSISCIVKDSKQFPACNRRDWALRRLCGKSIPATRAV